MARSSARPVAPTLLISPKAVVRLKLRVGGGEMVPAGPNAAARWRFLEAVRRNVPEAMFELKKIAHLLPDGPARSPAKHDQEAPLRVWALQWGFTAPERPSGPDWLLTVARQTAEWLRSKDDPAWPDAWVFTASYRQPRFQDHPLPPWNPEAETEASFRRRIDKHVETQKDIGLKAGWSVAPEKRNLDHFVWLALFQVGRLEYRAIADRCSTADGLDESRVEKGVKEAAKLVGLSLRTAGTHGRPRKSR
jgi:hypothetical protein